MNRQLLITLLGLSTFATSSVAAAEDHEPASAPSSLPATEAAAPRALLPAAALGAPTAPPPAARKTEQYGHEILLIDLASVGGIVAGVQIMGWSQDSDGHATPVAYLGAALASAGAVSVFAGPALYHWHKQDLKVAATSLGLRTLLPLAGWGLGAMIRGPFDDEKERGGIEELFPTGSWNDPWCGYGLDR